MKTYLTCKCKFQQFCYFYIILYEFVSPFDQIAMAVLRTKIKVVLGKRFSPT